MHLLATARLLTDCGHTFQLSHAEQVLVGVRTCGRIRTRNACGCMSGRGPRERLLLAAGAAG